MSIIKFEGIIDTEKEIVQFRYQDADSDGMKGFEAHYVTTDIEPAARALFDDIHDFFVYWYSLAGDSPKIEAGGPKPKWQMYYFPYKLFDKNLT